MVVFLLVVCGFLVGGAWSLGRQRHVIGAAVLGVAAVLAGISAALWWAGD